MPRIPHCFKVFCLVFALIPGFLRAAAPQVVPADKTKGFFPVSVWYPGGKARAPMLETVTPESRAVWKK
ncbi:MAG: hypothetical protein E4H35_09335, partial [Candidatus Aminicenantes bacterium]